MTRSLLRIALAVTLVAMPAADALAATTLNGQRPLVIGHRGASGYRPEHTLAAYSLAIDQGADFIEPDLVMTRDGVLVARHEPVLAIVNASGTVTEETTNVATLPQFANRLTTKVLDGVSVRGWWAEDFTLAELKTLRARERIPGTRPNNATFNDQFEVPTLVEVITLAKTRSAQLGRTIGVYPETKHPTYTRAVAAANGVPTMEQTLVSTLHAEYGNTSAAPVFIQSFEVANLIEMSALTDINIVQLLGASGRPFDFTATGDPRTYADLVTAAGLQVVNDYANGIGPTKSQVIPLASGALGAPTSLVADAHAAGLLVHAYTFRAENAFLPSDFDVGTNPNALGDLAGEIRAYLATGLDGVFTDHPNLAVAAVPEPTTLAALAAAAAGLVTRRRR